jgi:hypothetical protein
MTRSILMLDESRRQRAMRPEVAISRRALSVVQPINRRIGTWQVRAAHLAAIGRRAAATGRSTADVREEAESIFDMVKAEIDTLAEYQRDLPPAIAQSSRMVDTNRALQRFAEGLEAVLHELPE